MTRTRHIAFVLIAALLLTGNASSAFADSSSQNRRVGYIALARVLLGPTEAISLKEATGFDGRRYDVVERARGGYLIMDPEDGVIEEFSRIDPSPYLDSRGQLFYGGPTAYYHAAGADDVLSHVRFGDRAPVDRLKLAKVMREHRDSPLRAKSPQLSRAVTTGRTGQLPIQLASATGDIYVLNAGNIEYQRYPPNVTGICGCTAATMVLWYWNRRVAGTVNSTYLTADGTLRLTGYTLTSYLAAIGAGKCYNSWAEPISAILKSYSTALRISASNTWALSVDGAYNEVVVNRRPVILFGDIQNAGAHAVVAYGFNSGYYIVQYGWGQISNGVWVDTKRHVLLDRSWLCRTQGSTDERFSALAVSLPRDLLGTPGDACTHVLANGPAQSNASPR